MQCEALVAEPSTRRNGVDVPSKDSNLEGFLLPFHLNLESCLELALSTRITIKSTITSITVLPETSTIHSNSFKMELSSTLQLEQMSLGAALET